MKPPRFLQIALAVLLLSGCAQFRKWKPKWMPGKKSPSPASERQKQSQQRASFQARPVDPAAQQRHYDMGLKYYADEKYAEAKKAWQAVLQNGPNTPLAAKAREYLKKTEQVLKTLQEMEKQ